MEKEQLADEAYGSFNLREYTSDWETNFYIPPKSNSVNPWYLKQKPKHILIGAVEQKLYKDFLSD